MNVKKAIKRIAVLGIGATMLGATVLGAMAADLSEYPSPFVADGAFDGMMVVGDDAQPADIIGVTDVAMSLQFSATVTKTVATAGSSGSQTVVEGDAWEAKTSSNLWQLGDNITKIQTTLDDTDLNALADGTFSNNKGSFDYEQTLKFSEDVKADYTIDEDDVTGDFVTIASSANFANYSLVFSQSAETDVDSNDDWEDFHNRKLTMLGVDYTITDSDNSSEMLTLMGGAVQDTLEEGETKTYTIEGTDYEVTAVIVSDTSTQVKFKVNGEVTPAMSESETETLSDGTVIGVREILANEAGETAGGDIAEFYLGAEKMELQDESSLKLNEDTYSDVDVYVVGSPSSDEYLLDEIKLVWEADDDLYIGEGMKLSDVMDKPESLLNWDIEYAGLTAEDTEMIELVGSGDDKYKLKFVVAEGEVSLPFAYSQNTTHVKLGDKDTSDEDEDRLVLDVNNATNPIEKHDYFFLTLGGADDTGDKTYVFRYSGADKTTTNENGALKFKNMATGETITRSFDRTNNEASLRVGGEEFTFKNSTAVATANDFPIYVSAGSTTEGHIVTNYGAEIAISKINTDGNVTYPAEAYDNDALNVLVDINEVDEANQLDNLEGDSMQFVIKPLATAGGEIQLDVTATGSETWDFHYTLESHEENDDLQTAYTPYGALISYNTPSNQPADLDVEWPSEQQFVQVFVTSGEVSSSAVEGGSGTVTYEEPVRIDIGAAVLASDVADPTASNVITVGGSCVNEVTATLMGLDYPACGEASGLEPDTAVIKLIESGDKVAVVVAGWNPDDTRRATNALSDFEKWQDAGKLMGKEVLVTGTSLVSFDVTPVE